MYKDIISYQLAKNVSKEHLLAVAKKVAENWMKKLPGFIKWEIHEHADGTFTDIVSWQSEAAAKNAEKEMANLPNATEWVSCYQQDGISSKKLIQIASF